MNLTVEMSGIAAKRAALRQELQDWHKDSAEMQAERRRSSADKVQLYRQRRQQEKLAATKLQAVVRGMQAVAAWKSAMEQAQPSRRVSCHT